MTASDAPPVLHSPLIRPSSPTRPPENYPFCRGILPHRMRGLPSPLPDDDADAEQRQEPASPAATAAAARIRMWYQLLQTFKQQPDSIEFVYLRHADPAGTEWNPYNLEVVPHGGIKVRGRGGLAEAGQQGNREKGRQG